MNRKEVIKQILLDFFPIKEDNIFLIEEEDLDLLTDAMNSGLEKLDAS